MLDDCEKEGKSHIVSWLPNGKAFKVHMVPEFVATILPSYFKQSKYKSYQRQLNLWGFERVTRNGPEKGAYFHKNFLKGKPSLCRMLKRQRANKAASPASPKVEKPFQTIFSEQSRRRKDSASESSSTTSDSSIPPKDTSMGYMPKFDTMDEDFSLDILERSHEGRDNFEQSAPKLTFEGCQFFPLEKERYDELNSLVLKVGSELRTTSDRTEKDITGLNRRFSFLSLPTATVYVV